MGAMEFKAITPTAKLAPLSAPAFALPVLNGSDSNSNNSTTRNSLPGNFWVISGPARSGKSSLLLNLCEREFQTTSNSSLAGSRLVLINGREQVDRFRQELVLYRRALADTKQGDVAGRVKSGAPNFLQIEIKTFHALAFYILSRAADISGVELNPTLISASEQEQSIGEVISELLVSGWQPHPDLQRAISGTKSSTQFRRELRDFILRATERGSDPAELRSAAQAADEKYWEMLADIWQAYLWHLAATESLAHRFDAAQLMTRAIAALNSQPEIVNELRSQYPVILIDDFQECDQLQRRLIELISPALTVVAGDTDSAVNRFRGADPDTLLTYLAERATFRMELPAPRKLPTRHYWLAQSDIEMANQLIAMLWREHYVNGKPWSEMAIIARSLANYPSIFKRAALNQGVPLVVVGEQLPIAANNFVKQLLKLHLIAGQLTQSDWPWLEELLISPLCGADAAALRRTRNYLLAQRRSQEGSASDIDLAKESSGTLTAQLVELLQSNEPVPEQMGSYIQNFRHLRTIVQSAPSSNVADYFSRLWPNLKFADGSLVEQSLASRALAGGRDGTNADRDLDAIMQLITRAKREALRNPKLNIASFAGALLAEEVASDDLAAVSTLTTRSNAVTLTTLHQGRGQNWDELHLIGVNRGEWPNHRARSTLLGTERFIEQLRTGLSNKVELAAAMNSALVVDERRLFNVATTRANEKLSLWAIDSEDSAPSIYFEPKAAKSAKSFSAQDSYNFTAKLRRIFESQGDGYLFAGKLLKLANDAQIIGSQPEQWLGARELSTDEKITPDGQLTKLAPSSLEQFERCELRWFLQQNNFNNGDQFAALLGTSIHYLAQLVAENPELTLAELQERLVASWSIVDSSTGWLRKQNIDQALSMLERLYIWIENNPRKFLASEARFGYEISGLIVGGSIDRLEIDAHGNLIVVDYKTGKTPISGVKAESDGQLALYRLAASLGAIRVADQSQLKSYENSAESIRAELIYPAKDPLERRTQSGYDFDQIENRLKAVAARLGGNSFIARVGEDCRICDFKSACPADVRGGSLIDE
jgi:superfamily I DNA/RNA helicase/RecB family exonuclease